MQRTVAIVAAVLMAATTYAGHIALAGTPHYSTWSAPLDAPISGHQRGSCSAVGGCLHPANVAASTTWSDRKDKTSDNVAVLHKTAAPTKPQPLLGGLQ